MSLIEKIRGTIAGLLPKSAEAEPSGGSVDMGDRGLVRRRQRLNEGFIWSAQHVNLLPCTVRDMTYLGGRVDLWTDVPAADLKKGVVLYIMADGKEVECDVKWRRDRSLGLHFKGAFREPTRTYR